MTIKVLSLFDGMSCGQIALNRLGITDYVYFASEVDKHAIKVTQSNYPNTIQLGDVKKVSYNNGTLTSENGEWLVEDFDLVMGGSPCQSISTLGDGSGLEGKSGLFYHWLRVKGEVNPRNWLLENVVGKKKAIREITNVVGGVRYNINSNSITAQNRNRFYWTNIESIPKLEEIVVNLQDILQKGIPEHSILTEKRSDWINNGNGVNYLSDGFRGCVLDPKKAACLTANSEHSWKSNYVTREGVITRLTPIEYERLQTVPDNYTKYATTPQRYRMLGNGWTVDVIAHIIKHMDLKGELVQ